MIDRVKYGVGAIGRRESERAMRCWAGPGGVVCARLAAVWGRTRRVFGS